jgi:ureidoacrylate peracid hydrolase
MDVMGPESTWIGAAERSALVIIDMQNDFCHADGTFGTAGMDVARAGAIVPAIERLRAAARAGGLPVIHVRTEHSDATDTPAWRMRGGSCPGGSGNVRRGSWGAEWFGCVPEPDEQVVVKHRYSAFVGTDLDVRLRTAGVETVVVVGVVADTCVESTARDACMRDYFVVVPSDAVASYEEVDHAAAMRTISRAFGVICSTSEIGEAWSPQT